MAFISRCPDTGTAPRCGRTVPQMGGVNGLNILDDPFRLAHAFNSRTPHSWPPWAVGPTPMHMRRLPTDTLLQAYPLRGWDLCAAGLVWLHPVKSARALLELDAARRKGGGAAAAVAGGIPALAIGVDGSAAGGGSRRPVITSQPCGYAFDSSQHASLNFQFGSLRAAHGSAPAGTPLTGSRARGEARAL